MIAKKAKIMKDISRLLYEKHGIAESEVTLDADLKKDLGLDSLDVVELGMDVEKEFNISLPDEVHERLITVNDVLTAVEDRYNG